VSPQWLLEFAITPALRILPARMSSKQAAAMLLSIAMQESNIEHRRQVGGGAGRGYWQFEQGGGVRGVLTHSASLAHAESVLQALDYPADYTEPEIHAALEHNDILAAAFARLLLFTLPQPLPTQNFPGVAWAQYSIAWRPGRPHRQTFDAFYEEAWDSVLTLA
jgi:hypothetical protein